MTDLEAAGVGEDLEAEVLARQRPRQTLIRWARWSSICSTRRRRSSYGEVFRATRCPTTPTRTSRISIRAWRKCLRNSLQTLRKSRYRGWLAGDVPGLLRRG